MKEKLAPVILVIVILAALGFIFKQAAPKKPTYTMTFIDVKAKKIFTKKVTAGQQLTYPMKSPFSGENTAYPVYKCTRCGEIFAFIPYMPENPEKMPPMPPELMVPKCPKCGAIEIAVPKVPEGKKYLDVQQEEIPIVDMSKQMQKK